MKYNTLTNEESEILDQKHTEAPFTGEYDNFYKDGTYVCRKCNQPLFSSKSKFDAHCGWPAFDEEFPNSITRLMDKDGSRVEIVCSNCVGHLGHEFTGEQLTQKNVRHCVNSPSILFIPSETQLPKTIVLNEKATFAGGCFWCTEAVFKRLKGVLTAIPGFSGGELKNPTYEEVVGGDTAHAEAVQITFDPALIDYDTLLEVFFHFHDPTTLNRQGNDVGTQYRSEVFTHSKEQMEKAKKYISEYEKELGKKIVTKVSEYKEFYPASVYHLDYYKRNSFQPYCMFTITPKIQKLLKEYSNLVKE